MHKSNLFILGCCLGFMPFSASQATQLAAVTNDDSSGIAFKQQIQNQNQTDSVVYGNNELINFSFDLSVRSSDIGQNAHIYAVAIHNSQWYQLNFSGIWQRWNGNIDSLNAFKTKTLGASESFTLLDKSQIPAGEYRVYLGYQLEQTEQLFYNQQPASLLVFDETSPALHAVKNSTLLKDFFSKGVSTLRTQQVSDFSTLGMPIAAEAASDTGSSSVSQTNIQEIGVDEADRIKTDGNNLFVLEACQENSSQQCISSYVITETPASNQLNAQFNTEDHQWQQGNLYLTDIDDAAHLVYLSDSMNSPVFDIWFSPFSWTENESHLQIIAADNPESLELKQSIRIDASTISSRLIGGVLYIVSRKTAYPYTVFPTSLEDTLLENPASTEVAEINIEDLLPGIAFDDETEFTPLVTSSDCFLPNQNSQKPIDNTVVTITAIPLANPDSHYSTCIAGQVDTFYMSTQSIYLATSRYPFTVSNNDIIYPENQEMTTEIHKFALNADALEYKGSGSVPGHLGWETDKQPFRMGEFDGILKVATSQGDSWVGNPSTRVGVLREAENPKRLEEISHLDNLGKPGERLFAARFIANRGYLVTFRNTDPLYVLNFNDPENPEIVGELEINGYSDYLHPIGEHYLLGIGKDAIPSENADRGAFPQGLKLSLFDVSNAENLREIDSLVLGKRGSESAVLYDHHALAWLQQGESATLAIPVQINENERLDAGIDYTQPSAFYEWSETGLFTFAIQTGEEPSITQQGRLITHSAETECADTELFCYSQGQNTYNDRAVIQGDSVHYIHNNAVHSSAITDLD